MAQILFSLPQRQQTRMLVIPSFSFPSDGLAEKYVTLTKFSVSCTRTGAATGRYHEDGRSREPEAAAHSWLLMANPNIAQRHKRELKSFLSVTVPPPAPLGLCLMMLRKPFLPLLYPH